jgi:hypothetical protein
MLIDFKAVFTSGVTYLVTSVLLRPSLPAYPSCDTFYSASRKMTVPVSNQSRWQRRHWEQ